MAYSALAAAGRLLFVALPNVSLTFLVVAVAGLAHGPRFGALVGALAMGATGLALGGSPLTTLATALAAAALGALAGAVRGLRAPQGPAGGAVAMVFAVGFGAGIQVLFSLATDLSSWLLFAWLPEGAAALPLLAPLLAGGLLFNLPAVAFQAALFGATLRPVLHALRAAGLTDADADTDTGADADAPSALIRGARRLRRPGASRARSAAMQDDRGWRTVVLTEAPPPAQVTRRPRPP